MLLTTLFAVFQASASIPSVSPIELLSLPEIHRLEIAKKNAKELYPQLVEMAFNDQRSVPTRWKALILAANINQDHSTSALDRALKSDDWFMRNAALVAMKTIDPEKAQKVALELLNDKALVVRSAAISVIDQKPSTEIREILWNELHAAHNYRQNQSLWVRREIVEKLALHPTNQEYSSFIEVLKDSDKDLHLAAIHGLEKLTKKHLGSSKITASNREKLWTDYVKKNPVLR